MISFHQEGYCVRRRSQASHPAYLAGVPDALIFFCFLFFYQEKKRKWRLGDNAPNYTIDNDDYGTEKAGSAFQPSEHAPRFSF